MSRREVLMRALEATPRDLHRMLRSIRDEQARQVAPDGWSIMRVVTHLCEIEAEYVQHWHRALESDAERELPVLHKTLGGLVVGWTNQRERTLDFLRALKQHEWGTMLDHEGTPRRLREDVQALIAHDNEHLNQLLELREMVETSDSKE